MTNCIYKIIQQIHENFHSLLTFSTNLGNLHNINVISIACINNKYLFLCFLEECENR